MSSALHTVFFTAELLEAILLKLPMYDLLVTAQLISHSFHTAIISSVSLQQALFTRPINSPKRTSWDVNPLLLKAFWLSFRTTSNSLTRVTVNVLESPDWNFRSKKKQAYVRRDASWRRMLITQPPAITLRVVREIGLDTERFLYELRDGLRMELLYDLGEEIRGSRVGYFELRWGKFDPKDSWDGGMGTVRNGNVGEGQLSIAESADGQNSGRKQRKPEDDFTLVLRC